MGNRSPVINMPEEIIRANIPAPIPEEAFMNPE